MNEKLITAVIGLGVGIIIAAGIFFGPSLIKKVSPPPISPVSPIASSTPLPMTNSPMTIDSLENGAIVSTKTIEVAGRSFPQSTVIVTSPADEQTVISDDQGNFKVNLKIDEGENTILAAVTDQRSTLQIVKKQIILEINE